MKNRTFFTTLLLVLLAINALIAVLSLLTLRDTTRQEKERCLNSQYLAASSLIRDLAALERREIAVDSAMASLMQPYLSLSSSSKAALALYDNGVLQHTNGLLAETAVGNAGIGTRTVSLDRKGAQYLCTVSGALPEPYSRYTLLYQTDATDAMEAWRQRSRTMMLVGGAVSLALSFTLLLLLQRLFRPLTQISCLSRNIADGDYSVRLPEDGKDEVAQMARSFNHMAEEVKRTVTELAAAAKNRQQFVDNFSHELRTPLTNIHGYAEYLQRAALNEDSAHFALDCILSESRRMQAMANRLLELSGLRVGDIRMERIDLPALMREVRGAMEPKFADKDLTLSIDCQVEWLTGDKIMLHSLLSNLLDNAVKASDPHAVVEVQAVLHDGCTTLTVSDQGKGMIPESLARITEPFYRVDRARSRGEGGAGLGLALCQQIADCHGATISFDSVPGRGTTVTVTFTTP